MIIPFYNRLNLDVKARDIEVLRAASLQFCNRYRFSRSMRAQRHSMYRAILALHHAEQDLARMFCTNKGAV